MTESQLIDSLLATLPPFPQNAVTLPGEQLLTHALAYAIDAAALYDPNVPDTDDLYFPPNTSLGAATLAIRNLLCFVAMHSEKPLSLLLAVSVMDAKLRASDDSGDTSVKIEIPWKA